MVIDSAEENNGSDIVGRRKIISSSSEGSIQIAEDADGTDAHVSQKVQLETNSDSNNQQTEENHRGDSAATSTLIESELHNRSNQRTELAALKQHFVDGSLALLEGRMSEEAIRTALTSTLDEKYEKVGKCDYLQRFFVFKKAFWRDKFFSD